MSHTSLEPGESQLSDGVREMFKMYPRFFAILENVKKLAHFSK